jgi:hypothetical protein
MQATLCWRFLEVRLRLRPVLFEINNNQIIHIKTASVCEIMTLRTTEEYFQNRYI